MHFFPLPLFHKSRLLLLPASSVERSAGQQYGQLMRAAAQREALDAWLAGRYAKRELVYGLHVTDRAHMTCLVFNYSGRHLHFIDGADGGLFLAAKQFKERAAKLIPIDISRSNP